MRTILASLLLASSAIAAEPQVYRDLPYTDPKGERQTLDVYAPPNGNDHPIVFWIHGDGWMQGDNQDVQNKPQTFVGKGFVFVSLHVADHPETGAQSRRLVNALEAAGVPAKAFGAAGSEHDKLNNGLGLPDDKPTQALFEFVDGALKK